MDTYWLFSIFFGRNLIMISISTNKNDKIVDDWVANLTFAIPEFSSFFQVFHTSFRTFWAWLGLERVIYLDGWKYKHIRLTNGWSHNRNVVHMAVENEELIMSTGDKKLRELCQSFLRKWNVTNHWYWWAIFKRKQEKRSFAFSLALWECHESETLFK